MCFLIAPIFSWLLDIYCQEKTQKALLNGIGYKVVKFFGTLIVLRSWDDITDMLTTIDYFR